jgi:L-2,4-diaminobutyrate decarboxylase
MCEPQLSTVVFRYRPSRPEINADQVNAALRQQLLDRGIAVIGHTRVRNCQCLKFTCMNPSVTEAQMEALIAAIVEQGRELESTPGL